MISLGSYPQTLPILSEETLLPDENISKGVMSHGIFKKVMFNLMKCELRTVIFHSQMQLKYMPVLSSSVEFRPISPRGFVRC